LRRPLRGLDLEGAGCAVDSDAGEPTDVLRPARRTAAPEAEVKRRHQLLSLALVLALLVGIQVAREAFRWYAYAEERGAVRRLGPELEEAGVAVVRTQVRADTLRREIEAADRELGQARAEVAAYERHIRNGTIPGHLYPAYRESVEEFNRRVARRNARVAELEETIRRNHEAVARYNLVADSIRWYTRRMGEPYYSIPTPAELASGRESGR
jgi:hypothetical protein